jgi:hypothetical protein
MGFRVHHALALILVLSAVGCAARKHQARKHHPTPAELQAPPPRVVIGPFSLPPQVRVIAFHHLPEHFNTSIPPVWSMDGLTLSLIRIASEASKVVQFDGESLRRETVFDLTFRRNEKGGVSLTSLLDFAIDPKGARLAVAIDDPADNSVKAFVHPLAPDTEADLIATFPGQVENAGVAWMGTSDLLLGLGPTRATEGAAANAAFAGLYRLSTKTRGDNSQFVIDCKREVNLSRFLLGPGQRALVSASNGNAVFLLDLNRLRCRRAAFPGLTQIRPLGWSSQGSRMLYAAPLSARYSDVPAVFELNLGEDRRRLIGAPMAAATYVKESTIAIPGSRSLQPALLELGPDRLVPAQLGIMDEDKSVSETTIYPLGLWTSAALLVQATIAYSAPADALAIEIPVPAKKVSAPIIVGFPLVSRHVELIVGAQIDHQLLFSWAPSSTRLAVCDCAGKSASLLVVEPPLN